MNEIIPNDELLFHCVIHPDNDKEILGHPLTSKQNSFQCKYSRVCRNEGLIERISMVIEVGLMMSLKEIEHFDFNGREEGDG